jgi:hypothetical protein
MSALNQRGRNIETAVVAQSELKLVAEGANIGRGKQQFGGLCHLALRSRSFDNASI